MKRFAAGDSLRGIAAVSVVIYHAWFFAAGGSSSKVFGAGELGLYLFFVLSGYFISRSFIASYVADDSLPSVARYAEARALRIVPAFWVAFTVLLIINGSLGSSPGEIAAVYLFAQNYYEGAVSLLVGPAWTLDLEVIFYALIPIAGILAFNFLPKPEDTDKKIRAILLASLLLFLAGLVARELAPDTLGWRRAFPTMMSAFAPGIALAALEQRAERNVPAAKLARRWVPWAAGVGIALLVTYALGVPWDIPSRPGPLPILLASLGTGAIVAAALAREWLGERSYGLYLWHSGLMITLIAKVGVPADRTARFLALLAVGLVGGAIVADASYRLIERPALRLRRRRTPDREYQEQAAP
jgi:peptidoglycan/LPS O-acetylase OafA/YrhL